MSKKLSEGNASSKKTEKKKKKKKTVYGTYSEDRKTPKYVSSKNYKDGLTDEEVNERIENLQVNIEGMVESKFTKNFKLVFKVITKNTFTFFNILYIIVLILLLVANAWNKQAGVNDSVKQLLNLGSDKTFEFGLATFSFVIIVSINLVIGIIQETKSKIAINKLKLLTNPKVTLVRNGEKVVMKETDVVLDDIVYLTPGIQIVADMVLLEGEVEVNESQLTGESVPIKKKVNDVIYSGSFMVSGTSYAKVIHVAKMNEINKLTSQAKKYTEPNSQILSGLRKLLVVMGFIIVITSVAMYAWSWNWKGFRDLLYGGDLSNPDLIIPLKANYIVAIKPITAAIIGMIPAGLYLLTSVALSVGVFRLSKHNTLVQDNYCIEMLARVNVLCLDKTGTITNGKMTVIKHEIINEPDKTNIEDVISSMNAALQETNATAQALANYYGIKSVLTPTMVVPFSSDRKYSAVSFGETNTYIIGAPEFVLKSGFEKYADKISDYANKGLRVLCLAHSNLAVKDGKVQRVPKLIALILIEDQIREEAKDTIEYFKESGVEVKVISGDNPVTVSEVARRVGIENASKCVSLDGMSEDEVIEAASKFTVFGRVKPEQKKLLVQALKKQGKTVAMTGDGVNDIPALKEADCSIAMASGNDSVKGVAQLVLVDSNFASMPKVVAEGRRVINNVQQTAMLYLVKTLFMTFLAILTASGFFYLLGQKDADIPLYQRFLRNATFPFSGSNQLLILEMFAIGIPSMFLALQANNTPVKGNFMRNALKSAIPGAAGIVGAIVFTYWFSREYGFEVPEVKTVVAMTATLTLLVVMCRACLPFNKKKVVLCILMWVVSIACILTSMKGKTIGIPKTKIKFDFEYESLKWDTVRIVDKATGEVNPVNVNITEQGYILLDGETILVDGKEYKIERASNATATWLAFSMVVVSITLMLGVELLIKNLELKQERMKHKEFEKIKEKKKNPQVLKIKY